MKTEVDGQVVVLVSKHVADRVGAESMELQLEMNGAADDRLH